MFVSAQTVPRANWSGRCAPLTPLSGCTAAACATDVPAGQSKLCSRAQPLNTCWLHVSDGPSQHPRETPRYRTWCLRADSELTRSDTLSLAVYLYSAMNDSWKFFQFSRMAGRSFSSGRMVVRRWKVPAFCPKPEPGTVEMPVDSSSFRQ